jgi:hypothetical protein
MLVSKIAQRVAERFLAEQLVEAAGPGYAAIFLHDNDKRRLLMWWRSSTREPLLPVIFADHVTLKFKPSKADIEKLPVGEEALVQVLGFASDEKGQAVLVRPSVASHNRLPHITIATARGVSPVYSNDLLAEGYTRKSGPILRGVVDVRT